MTTDEIKASRAICDAATPGPLSIQEPFVEHISVVVGEVGAAIGQSGGAE